MNESDSSSVDFIDLDLIDDDVDSTLDALIINPLIIGACTSLLSLLFLGCAIHMGWNDDLAPRISNRPVSMLRNAMVYHLPRVFKRSGGSGSGGGGRYWWYPIAWIGWAYEFTYAEGLTGIPGTGTRRDGREGPRLKINLDAVILLRFQALMFKVSVLVAFLCLFFVMPVNLTARCDPEIFGVGTCGALEDQGTFMRTTIANIPDKIVSLSISLFVLLVCALFFFVRIVQRACYQTLGFHHGSSFFLFLVCYCYCCCRCYRY